MEWTAAGVSASRTTQDRDDKRCSPKHSTSLVSHLGSGPLLKIKVQFVFRFEQRRKSRDFPESKLPELRCKFPQELVWAQCDLSSPRSVRMSTRTL